MTVHVREMSVDVLRCAVLPCLVLYSSVKLEVYNIARNPMTRIKSLLFIILSFYLFIGYRF